MPQSAANTEITSFEGTSHRGDTLQASENYTTRHHNGSHTSYTGHARGRPHADDELAPGSHTDDTMDPLQHYFWTVNKHLECI